MTKTLKAVYDGEVLRPDEPLDLEPNTRVRVTIEVEHKKKEPYAFLRVARSLKLEGPSDWSTRLDYYLYKTHRYEDS
ncbi:MAG TPA: antitoxin family protein [Pyrinomonadaceae bacterium]|nr:antitoxin family protein [Pyrinomonadaceae bacterium]